MVIAAALFSSIQMKSIDTSYSSLIARDVNALQNLTFAQATNNRFAGDLYKEIAEPDLDQMRVIDSYLDQETTSFHSSLAEAKRSSPDLGKQIDAISNLFDKLVSDSLSVRAATQANQNDKAMRLMRESIQSGVARDAQGAHRHGRSIGSQSGQAIGGTVRSDAPDDPVYVDVHRAWTCGVVCDCCADCAG